MKSRLISVQTATKAILTNRKEFSLNQKNKGAGIEKPLFVVQGCIEMFCDSRDCKTLKFRAGSQGGRVPKGGRVRPLKMAAKKGLNGKFAKLSSPEN